MGERQPTETTNLDRYGFDALPWERAKAVLLDDPDPTRDKYFVLGTVRLDGRPHAAGVGAAAFQGDLFFTANDQTRKARNLADNPACTVTVRLSGIDLVLEGEATPVTDRETLAAVVAVFQAGGWPAEVDADGEGFTAPYSAPSAGPPPWHLYRFTFHTVFGVATEEPSGATRWRFDR